MKIEQKKGNPDIMHGKLTAYARVNTEVNPGYDKAESPLMSMISSGFLVAQGNYRDQHGLRDFLMQELGTSMDDEEGIKNFVEGLEGLEGALDPDKFREKINHLEEIEEFIPTPAKMVQFHSEDAILQEEGDIYYVGEFINIANANLAVNAMTILYQSQYRETQLSDVRTEIDDLIGGLDQITHAELPPVTTPPKVEVNDTVLDTLLRQFIPELFLTVDQDEKRTAAEVSIREYLDHYRHQTDVERLITLTKSKTVSDIKSRLINLYCQKIDMVLDEKFDILTPVVDEIHILETKLKTTEE